MNINIEAFMAATDSRRMNLFFSEQLPRHLGFDARVVDVIICRVIPRRKGGFSIQYNVRLNVSTNDSCDNITIFGHLLGPDEKKPSYVSQNRDAIFSEELNLALPIFPFDPELPQLKEYWDESMVLPRMSNSLSSIATDTREARIHNKKLLGYRLERRCVIEYELSFAGEKGPNINMVAKIGKGAAMVQPWLYLQKLGQSGFGADSADRLTVPVLYGVDRDSEAYFTEFVEGTTLHDLLGQPEFRDGCVSAGKVIAKLHCSKLRLAGDYSYRDEIAGLKGKFLITADIFPRWHDAFWKAYSLLEDKSRSLAHDFAPAVVHRDFYDKQVLFSSRRTTLLDCDGLMMGDPALDIGNFIAHLHLRTLQNSEHERQLEKAAVLFEEAYGSGKLALGDRTSWWTAATLIRLAGLYGLRPRWRTLAPALLEKAINVLGG
jgi:hypothetical protein